MFIAERRAAQMQRHPGAVAAPLLPTRQRKPFGPLTWRSELMLPSPGAEQQRDPLEAAGGPSAASAAACLQQDAAPGGNATAAGGGGALAVPGASVATASAVGALANAAAVEAAPEQPLAADGDAGRARPDASWRATTSEL